MDNKNSMSFSHFSQVNITRGNRWHQAGIEEWTLSDWAVAMAGEAGEACDAIKKLRRIQTGAANNAEHQIDTIDDAILKIGDEIADTVIYCDLLIHRLSQIAREKGLEPVTLEQVIKRKFNKTSLRYDFPERL